MPLAGPAADIHALICAASASGLELEDIACHVVADEAIAGGVERLDWEGIEREQAFRLIAQGILSVDDPPAWQRVLDRLNVLPERLQVQLAMRLMDLPRLRSLPGGVEVRGELRLEDAPRLRVGAKAIFVLWTVQSSKRCQIP